MKNYEIEPTEVEVQSDSQETINDRPHLKGLEHLFFFIGGLFFIIFSQLITEPIFQGIAESGKPLLSDTLANLTIYLLTFLGLSALLYAYQTLKSSIATFARGKTYIYGFFYGFIVILTSVSVGLLMTLIGGETDANQNQKSLEEAIRAYPFISFIWVVIFGPIVEELMYRVGLYSSLRRVNIYLAFALSALIFAFIHFNIPYNDDNSINQALLIEEFLNLPSYLVSGLLFAYIYEKEGFGVSVTAHMTNNLLSFIITIIRGMYGAS